MANLTADFDSFISNIRALTKRTVDTTKTFYAGGLVQLDASGKIRPLDPTSSNNCVGQFVRLSPDGLSAEVREGDIYLELAGSGAPVSDDIGDTVYAADDHSVSTSSGAYPCKAGILVALEGAGAIVRTTLEAAR